MRKESKVRLIARTQLDYDAIRGYLDDIGTKASVPDNIIEFAGRLCYKSWEPGLNPNVTKVRTEGYIQNLLDSGHLSVFEHVHLTFLFQDVTRVFTHELVRHRIGSFSQESLRYVRLEDLNYFCPKDLEDIELHDRLKVVEYMENFFRQMGLLQRDLAKKLKLDSLDFTEKKKLTSFMRRFAPIGLCTNIIWTTNLRNLMHVFSQRLSEHAEVEIRGVFQEVERMVKIEYPEVFN